MPRCLNDLSMDQASATQFVPPSSFDGGTSCFHQPTEDIDFFPSAGGRLESGAEYIITYIGKDDTTGCSGQILGYNQDSNAPSPFLAPASETASPWRVQSYSGDRVTLQATSSFSTPSLYLSYSPSCGSRNVLLSTTQVKWRTITVDASQGLYRLVAVEKQEQGCSVPILGRLSTAADANDQTCKYEGENDLELIPVDASTYDAIWKFDMVLPKETPAPTQPETNVSCGDCNNEKKLLEFLVAELTDLPCDPSKFFFEPNFRIRPGEKMVAELSPYKNYTFFTVNNYGPKLFTIAISAASDQTCLLVEEGVELASFAPSVEGKYVFELRSSVNDCSIDPVASTQIGFTCEDLVPSGTGSGTSLPPFEQFEFDEFFGTIESKMDISVGPQDVSTLGTTTTQSPVSAYNYTNATPPTPCDSCCPTCNCPICPSCKSCCPSCQLSSFCFPSHTRVTLADGVQKTMGELNIGDMVLSMDENGKIVPSPVYVMPHAEAKGIFKFKRIATESQDVIFATHDHFVYVVGSKSKAWQDRRAVPAGEIGVGDEVWVTSAYGTQGLNTSIVVDVKDVYEKGLYAPFTLTGTIIADDVVASVYNTMLGSEQTMHAFCAWGRWLWRILPGFFKIMHSYGYASKTAMAIGHAARFFLDLGSSMFF